MLTPERVGELLSDPDVVELVAHVGRLSREAGYAQAEADAAASWSLAARRVRAVLKLPTQTELRRRREATIR